VAVVVLLVALSAATEGRAQVSAPMPASGSGGVDPATARQIRQADSGARTQTEPVVVLPALIVAPPPSVFSTFRMTQEFFAPIKNARRIVIFH
jgi:hypothetical protein